MVSLSTNYVNLLASGILLQHRRTWSSKRKDGNVPEESETSFLSGIDFIHWGGRMEVSVRNLFIDGGLVAIEYDVQLSNLSKIWQSYSVDFVIYQQAHQFDIYT